MTKPFAVPTTSITVGDHTLTLRGISVRDVSILLRNHGAALALLYARYVQKNDDIVDQQVNSAVQDIAGSMPDLVAEVISLASRNVLTPDEAAELSLPHAVDALTAIGEVTFSGEGAWEKFLASVLAMVESAASAISKATGATKKPSPNGTADTATPYQGSFKPVS